MTKHSFGHSFGPWAVFSTPLGVGVSNADADVAHCNGFDGRRSREEEEANARLIAAAPDLLAAAVHALDGAVADDMDDWFAELRAAVTKAQGIVPAKPDNAAYLRNLAERLMHVPAMYGTDQGDCDRLAEIANGLAS